MTRLLAVHPKIVVVSFLATEEPYLFSETARPSLGSTQPLIQRLPGVKRPGLEADHSRLCSAETKKQRKYTYTPPFVLERIKCLYCAGISLRYLWFWP